MTKFSSPRLFRAALGLAAVGAFAVAPVVAQAATTDANGTLTAGGLTNSAPPITAFNLTLDGLTHIVTTQVGAWNVTDATGSNAGYSVTVAASDPIVTPATGPAVSAGTGGSLTLTPSTAAAAANNPAPTGPVAETAQLLSTTAATIDNAPAGTGQGEWDFAADPTGTKSLSIVVPGDASAGTYSSTLTFTTAVPVA